MATIRLRGAHQWHVQVRKRGWPTQTKTFDTKAEASAWAKMIESEMNRGVWLDRGEAESTTLRELLDRYEREVVPVKKGAAQEVSVLAAWRETVLAVRTVASVRGADVAALRDEWLQLYAPATVLRRLAVLSHVFNTARKEWGMESLANPVELIRKPAPRNARTRRVTALPAAGRGRGRTSDEAARLMAASESPTLPQIVTLAIETAMRRGEIAALRWEHIDLVRRTAHLPETKNGDARDIPLSAAAVDALVAMLPAGKGTEKGKRRKAPTVPATLRGSVFAVRPDGITQAFERARERARSAYEAECAGRGQVPDPAFLVDLRFHDMRHEGTSRLASKFAIHELAKITGHKDTRMLLRYYHPDMAMLAKRL